MGYFMKIFKKILLCAFALVFLACSSKDYSPKIQASKEKTEFSSRYNVENKGKAPAKIPLLAKMRRI